MKTKPLAVTAILLILAVIAVFSIGGMVSAGGPDQLVKTYVKGDVEALIQVCGSDVAVTVLDGEDTDKISSIYIYYKSAQIPRNGENTCNNVELGKTITFSNMTCGLTGEDYIIVEAVFDDFSTKIIGTVYCNFT